jgi:hypothetical protein
MRTVGELREYSRNQQLNQPTSQNHPNSITSAATSAQRYHLVSRYIAKTSLSLYHLTGHPPGPGVPESSAGKKNLEDWRISRISWRILARIFPLRRCPRRHRSRGPVEHSSGGRWGHRSCSASCSTSYPLIAKHTCG